MAKHPYYYAEMDSPIGILTVVQSSKGVCFIEFGSASDTSTSINMKLRKLQINATLLNESPPLKMVEEQLCAYFNGELKDFRLPLDLIGTRFQKLVWEKVASIPYGVTKSYKQIATEIGSPKAVRAIGGANNRNPVPIIIPCHRVIGTNGSMVGYGGGLDKKEILLRLEGSFERISS
ncbi:methylated-DNA--[protein]-cysteine S-methyltransferase [Salipaludibacillus sp. CF4.18]|uniref:methylated-DNA--[protein]-cysteine S-methyltransferase n=1 Tax=Salipaludibacillus sp. CF4.18 TaxID=3373081 RepID=UPI003EE4C105